MMINCIIFFVISGFLKMPFDKKSWRKMKFANLPINIVPCSRLGCDRFVDFIKKGDTFFYFNCNCEGIVCSSCYSQSFCSHIPYECKYCGGTYDLALFRSKFNYLVPPRYLYWQQFLSRFQQFNPRISNWVIFSRMMHHCHHMLFDDEERNTFFRFFLRLQSPILRTHVAAHRRKLSHLAITPQLCWTLLQLSWTRKLICRMFEQPIIHRLFYHDFLQTTGLSVSSLKAMHALLRRVMSQCGPKWKTML